MRGQSAGRSRRCRRGVPRSRRPPRPRRLARPHGARSRCALPARRAHACASCAKRWRATTVSPISPSPCRVWAPARSACSAMRRSGNGSSARAAGEAIAAFALTEQKSGSDVANIALTAKRYGDGYVLDGEKTWISNGGIADLYVVFARTGEGPGAKGLSAFLLPKDLVGFSVAENIEVIAPHPLARLKFERVTVPASADDRRARRRVQDRHGDAGHLSRHGRRRRARLRPPRARRDSGAGEDARAVRRPARRSADGAECDRRHGGRCGCDGVARLSRRLG